MQKIQYLFGFASAPKAPEPVHPVVARHQQTAKEKPLLERYQEQLLAQQMNVEAEQALGAEAKQYADKALREGDQKAWMSWTRDEHECKRREETWRNKAKNTQHLLRLQEGAQNNLQQGLLMQEANAELGQTVRAMEALDVQDTIDTTKELAAQVSEYDREFAASLVEPEAEQLEFEEGLADEWERLTAGRLLAQLPDAGGGTGGAKASAVAPRTEMGAQKLQNE